LPRRTTASSVFYSGEALEKAATAYRRLEGFATRAAGLTGGGEKTVTRALGEVRAMLSVLGLDPLSEQWVSQRAGEGLRPLVNALVGLALEQRQAARGRKDYAIRARLIKAGLTVEDARPAPAGSCRADGGR
jgi:cysteinyl-tRNA synthetase